MARRAFSFSLFFSSDVRVALSICTRNLSVWTIYFSPSRAGKLRPFFVFFFLGFTPFERRLVLCSEVRAVI